MDRVGFSEVDRDLVVRADSNQVDHVPAGQAVFRRPDHDQVVPHSNVSAARPGLRPGANVDQGANADPAAVDRPISNLVDSSICRATVTLVSEVPSLIADMSAPAVRGTEGPVKAAG